MDNSTAALLQDYLCSRDEAVRNEIVLKNLGLVRSCALSLRNMYIKFGDVDDVVNEGVIALMEAIESYDPDKGAKFETYATLKIRGAIIDFVRGQDWIPRSVRKFARDLDNANSSLYNQYNRMDLHKYGLGAARSHPTLNIHDRHSHGVVNTSPQYLSKLVYAVPVSYPDFHTPHAGTHQPLHHKVRKLIHYLNGQIYIYLYLL